MINIIEEITYKIVSFSELERFINENLDFLDTEWEICDHEEWSHDSKYDIIVDGNVDDFLINEVESQAWLSANNILNYLCYKGKLEKGNYLIDYSW